MSTYILRNTIRAWITMFLLLVSTVTSHGDGLEKGFERLKVYDYFQAKALFEKALKKQTAGGAYGLSLIYASGNNPFFNLDTARKFILIADSTLSASTTRQLTDYLELGVTAVNISRQRDTICQRAFRRIENSGSVALFNHYLEYFSFCMQQEEALALRNKAALADARQTGTSIAYKTFMETYPESEEWKEAKALYEERLYEECTVSGDPDSYRKYLTLYPDGPYKQQAEGMVYKLSVKHNTLDEYDAFIRQNRESSYLPMAWREVYRISMKDFNETTYRNFRSKYPDYPYMDELEQDYRLLNSLLIPFRKNGMWGYINESGKEIIKPVYEDAEFFSEGYAAVKMNGKFGFINKAGKTAVGFQYDEAEPFHTKTAVVGRNDLYGLISPAGEVLIPLEYEDLSDPAENVCIGIKDEKAYLISKTGKLLTAAAFDFAGEFRDGFSVIGLEEQFGILGKNGQVTVKPAYDQLFNEGNGLFRGRKQENWGLISASGEIKAPFAYRLISSFSEGKALVVKGGKCGFMDESGRVLIPVTIPFTENLVNTALFRNGYVVVRQKLKPLLFDSLGNKLPVSSFEDVGWPSDGLIPVRKNKKWGYAAMNGKIKIPCKFQQAGSFQDGCSKIRINNKAGIIDTTGKFILQAGYDDISREKYCYLVRTGDRWGLASLSGDLWLIPDYEKIEIIENKIALAVKNERNTFVNLHDGRVLLKEN